MHSTEARDTGLLELVLHGFRPDLVLALHDDCVALGDVEIGMRWLARHSSGLRFRREISLVLGEPMDDPYAPSR